MYPHIPIWGNPPSSTLSRLFWLLNFTLHPCSILFWENLTVVIYHFFWARQQDKGKGTDPISTLRPPTGPLPQHRPPPTQLPLISNQGKFHAAPRHFTSLHAAGGMFPLCYAEYYLCALTLVLLWYFLWLAPVVSSPQGGNTTNEGPYYYGGRVEALMVG